MFFDEAKTLVKMNYYNALRWVLDQVIPKAWEIADAERTGKEKDTCLPFMAMFLGTNSKVADFLPPGVDSSARYFSMEMTIPQPFTALDWDIKLELIYLFNV